MIFIEKWDFGKKKNEEKIFRSFFCMAKAVRNR